LLFAFCLSSAREAKAKGKKQKAKILAVTTALAARFWFLVSGFWFESLAKTLAVTTAFAARFWFLVSGLNLWFKSLR
jgi:hypothetical protein